MGRKPRRSENAEITFTATVRAEQLCFGAVPQTRTEFSGTPGHDSASGSERVNIPEHVEKDVTYRNIRVDYWLSAALLYGSEALDAGPEPWSW